MIPSKPSRETDAGLELNFSHHLRLNGSAFNFNSQISRLTSELSLLTFTEMMSSGLA